LTVQRRAFARPGEEPGADKVTVVEVRKNVNIKMAGETAQEGGVPAKSVRV
jgi:hypothetical protein